MLEDAGGAFRADAHPFLARKIDCLAFLFGVLSEIEFSPELGVELERRREGPSHLAAKPGQGSDLLLADELRYLFSGPFAPGYHLPHIEVARQALELAIVLLDQSTAFGTRHVHRCESGIRNVAVPNARDQVVGRLGDMVHEGVARQPAFFHLLELVLPFASQFRRRQFSHAKVAQGKHEGKGLGRWHQLTPVAVYVLFLDQAFDDGCAGCRRAQALLIHRGAQFLVFDELAGTLHRRQQGRLGVPCRRLGLGAARLDGLGIHFFAGSDRHQVLVFAGDLASVHCQPARRHQHLALGLELVPLHLGDAGGLHEFRRRVEHRKETLDHQVVDLLLDLAQRLGREQRRDNGEVIGNLGVVENPLVRLDPLVLEHILGVHHVGIGLLQHLHGLLDRGNVVLGQRARVSTRISQHLVALVERLRHRQGVARRQAETAVDLALQAGQVEQQGRRLGGRLGLLADAAGLAGAGCSNGVGVRLHPDALGTRMLVVLGLPELRIEPATVVLPRGSLEGGVHLPVIARLERANALLTFNQHRQGGGLHPAYRGQIETTLLRVEGGHRAGAVDADQPVRLAAALGCIRKRQELTVLPQGRKALLDGRRRHRLQP